jgi:general L-amino acid transport system permease protein
VEHTAAAPPKVALWNNPVFRALLYQGIVLSACVAAVVFFFVNTFNNLKQRGISSGFGFLSNEAGFGISEVVSIPRLEGGFLVFVVTVAACIAATWGLSAAYRRKGRALGDSMPGMALGLAVLVGIPAIVLFATAGSFTAETYTEASNYRIALLTGLLNTLKLSAVACVLATVVGVIVGLGRLSGNWLISRLALTYVEVIRNIPLLLQLFFWYKAVLRAMPEVDESLKIGRYVTLNNRGVFLPGPEPRAAMPEFLAAILLALMLGWLWSQGARLIQERTGRQLPVLYPVLGLLVLLPAGAWLAFGTPFELTYPKLDGFNFTGGLALSPEYAAMLLGLVLYTAAFIAEIVRSGISAISKGQREAAMAVGLRSGQSMRLVILPQALRVIIPPMTSQYLNLTKNSSLGVAIAFPELVSVGGTILNQSGQAIEIIAVTMAVYLSISLLISLGMNWYNAKVRLVER